MQFWTTTPSKLDSSGDSDRSPEEKPGFWSTSSNTNTECILYRMADQSEEESDSGGEDFGGGGTELRDKIRKLEQKKAKLEKRDAERRQLEQKYKELEKSVKSLKSSTSSGYGSASSTQSSTNSVDKNRSNRSSTVGSVIGSGIAGMLNEQKARLAKVTQGRSEAGPVPEEATDDDSSESDEDKDSKNLDKVMSKEHKQKLQDHRDTLVENMMADDIFNDLIANKVLTTADVGRIKEKNTRESINEELLNNLTRRSDRAFYEFVRSLRKTLQGYLADLLDEPPPRPVPTKKRKRKRQKGEINVSVDCEEILPTTKRKPPSCSCQEVEEQILEMAKTAYHTIRRRDHTPASFEQFKKELSQTNEIVKDTMEIMHTLKILCKHGDVSDVSYGSVKFTIRCATVDKLNALWDMYTTGSLLSILQKGLVTQTLLKRCRVRDVKLRVRLAEEEYHQCYRELEIGDRLLGQVPSPEKRSKVRSSHDRVLRSASKSRNCSENLGPSKSVSPILEIEPRTAFKEIHKNLTFSKHMKSVRTTLAQCEKVTSLQKKRVLFHTRLRSTLDSTR